VSLIAWRRAPEAGFIEGMWLWFRPGILLPIATAIAFVIIGIWVRRRFEVRREAGQNLMLYGLLWLIVYDTAFVAGYIGWGPALVVLGLLPVAYLSVQLMRWWGKVIAASQRPEFKRAL
jgi:hypothetical protein